MFSMSRGNGKAEAHQNAGAVSPKKAKHKLRVDPNRSSSEFPIKDDIMKSLKFNIPPISSLGHSLRKMFYSFWVSAVGVPSFVHGVSEKTLNSYRKVDELCPVGLKRK